MIDAHWGVKYRMNTMLHEKFNIFTQGKAILHRNDLAQPAMIANGRRKFKPKTLCPFILN